MSINGKPYVWVMTAEYAPHIIGGLGTVATQLTRALKLAQVNVTVITQSTGRMTEFIKNNQATVLRIPNTANYVSNKTYKPAKTEAIIARHIQRKPNLIHVHSLEFAETALFFKRKYGTPIIYTCHSLVATENKKRVSRSKRQAQLMRSANRIIVPSLWLKKEILKRHPGMNAKIKVIPNGVLTFSNLSTAPRYKLLFVGRLVKSKGIEALITALPILRAHNKNVHLTVVGKGAPRYRGRLRQLARKNNVLSNIQFVGALPHNKVQRLYSSYGAVIVPSKQESFCLVALEALANGTPLVSSRAGGLKEFVNSTNAQIIPFISSKAIGRVIVSMWNNPSVTMKRTHAGKIVAKHYSWSKIARRYKSIYASI